MRKHIPFFVGIAAMKRWSLLILCGALPPLCVPASAETVLNDWCINNNGSVGAANNQPSNSCNGGILAPDPNVNITGFDTTLSPAANSLGSIAVSFGTGNQYIGVYMDYDVDFATFLSFDDYGTVNGLLPAGVSFEMDDPNSGSLFGDFASGTLTNMDHVDQTTCAANAPANCDVAWALAQSLFVNPALYSGGAITFKVSDTAPNSGFYLRQTNADTGNSIYLSESLELVPITVGAVPEPGSWILLVTGVAFIAATGRGTNRVPLKENEE
jgi:hypothetical protein